MLIQAARRSLSSSSQYVPTDPKSLNWNTLGFAYVPTRAMFVTEFENGKWGPIQLQTEPFVRIHALSNVLHYGQALFEGLKAFEGKDKTVRVFRADENAKRLQRGAKRLGMPAVPSALFNEMMDSAIRENIDYVPPYGTGGSLYLRPYLFGHGPKLGLGKAPSYTFGVLANPVGNYYPHGPKPVKGVVLPKYDRAAPFGVGNVKAAGNYAPDVVPSSDASARGYTIVLYLDAATHEYVEEFSTSNFIAISKDGKSFVTPESPSILGSVTNMCLQQIAQDIGLKIERRPVKFSEVAGFKEVAACGTAVVITPLAQVTDERDPQKHHEIKIGNGEFPVMMELYNRVRAIQNGDAEDKHGWCRFVCKRS